MSPRLQTGKGLEAERQTSRSSGSTKAKWVITECWKSCSQVFACSRAAFSGALLKTSSAERTAWTLAMVVQSKEQCRVAEYKLRVMCTPQ